MISIAARSPMSRSPWAAASVISGGTSVMMIAISTATREPRQKDRVGTSQRVRPSRCRRQPWKWQIGLRQGVDQISKVTSIKRFNRAPRPHLFGRLRAQRLKVLRWQSVAHGISLVSRSGLR